MNPLHSSDELYFQISSANYSLPILTTPEDHQILHEPVINGSGFPSTSQIRKGKKQKQLSTWGTEDYNKITTDDKKKMMHREIEKQRRQDMARLCTTFRSLLPLEYIKGKRSTSDHIHEGTNYINYLENKVKQLQAKKEGLMMLSNLSPVGPEIGSFTIHRSTYVTVHPCPGGVQIKCSYSFTKHVFPLSRLLEIVLKEGLNVVHSTSTKTDDHRFIYTIRSEDQHMMTGTDYTKLQRKLIGAISSSSLEETV